MSPAGPQVWNGPLYQRAVGNVERMLNEIAGANGTDLLQKEVAIGAGLSESVLSSKLKGLRSHFYEDEFGALAEFFRKITGLPLVAFPHLPWEMQESVDRKVGGWTGPWKPKRR